MATQADVLRELEAMHASGIRSFRANTLAERLWPDQRRQNTNGQVFPLGSGVAGRMLRRCAAVIKVRECEWQIIPERLPNSND